MLPKAARTRVKAMTISRGLISMGWLRRQKWPGDGISISRQEAINKLRSSRS
jgi:hypothetical protein